MIYYIINIIQFLNPKNDVLIPFADLSFVLTAFGVRDCSDVGKDPVGNINECQEAATELGKRYRYEVHTEHRPKGCFLLYSSFVYWNNHETGNGRDTTQPICRQTSKKCKNV